MEEKLKIGDKRQYDSPTSFTDGTISIMAIAGKYLMVRRKYCPPFVITLKEFLSLEPPNK